MWLACHTIAICIASTSIFTAASSMTQNWPHYQVSQEDNRQAVCTCVHMESIIEYFKDKNDLTMVLGAGNRLHDYVYNSKSKHYDHKLNRWINGCGPRFPGYNFLVCNELLEDKLVKSSAELKDKTEPILIPLDFNSQYFFNFLDALSGHFKEIIFDYSVAKSITKKNIETFLSEIFKALQDGGEFYLDEGFASGGLTGGRVSRSTLLNTLGKAGFEAKYKEKAEYPLNKPWGPHPDLKKINFSSYDYIYAHKPIGLNKRLTLLKDSLTQLKNKLVILQEKLGDLRGALSGYK